MASFSGNVKGVVMEMGKSEKGKNYVVVYDSAKIQLHKVFYDAEIDESGHEVEKFEKGDVVEIPVTIIADRAYVVVDKEVA